MSTINKTSLMINGFFKMYFFPNMYIFNLASLYIIRKIYRLAVDYRQNLFRGMAAAIATETS